MIINMLDVNKSDINVITRNTFSGCCRCCSTNEKGENYFESAIIIMRYLLSRTEWVRYQRRQRNKFWSTRESFLVLFPIHRATNTRDRVRPLMRCKRDSLLVASEKILFFGKWSDNEEKILRKLKKLFEKRFQNKKNLIFFISSRKLEVCRIHQNSSMPVEQTESHL